MRILWWASVVVCLTFSIRATTAPEIQKAIRNNDLAALRQMNRQELAEMRDSRAWSSVHYAALYGSVEAVKIVLGAGEFLLIPANTPHAATAEEDTVDVDVFAPRREDWIRKDDDYLRK